MATAPCETATGVASQWACSFCGAPTDFSSSGGAVRVPQPAIPPQTYADAQVREGVLSFCWPCRQTTDAGRAFTRMVEQGRAAGAHTAQRTEGDNRHE